MLFTINFMLTRWKCTSFISSFQRCLTPVWKGWTHSRSRSRGMHIITFANWLRSYLCSQLQCRNQHLQQSLQIRPMNCWRSASRPPTRGQWPWSSWGREDGTTDNWGEYGWLRHLHKRCHSWWWRRMSWTGGLIMCGLRWLKFLFFLSRIIMCLIHSLNFIHRTTNELTFHINNRRLIWTNSLSYFTRFTLTQNFTLVFTFCQNFTFELNLLWVLEFVTRIQ